MPRYLLAVLAALALVGCAGLSGGPTPTETETAETPMPSIAEPTSAPDTTALIDTYRTRFGAADSGTIVRNTTVRAGERAIEADSVVRFDRGGEQAIEITEERILDDPTRRVTYTAGSETYRRSGTGADATYTADVRPVRPTNWSSMADTTGLIAAPDWEPAGTGTVRGVAVRQYTASSFANASRFGADEFENLTLSSARLSVDRDGLIRELRVTFGGRLSVGPREVTLRVVVADLGGTTVSPPDWLSTAQERTR
ncbi:DUF7537 family lipoprotein [Halorientalis pallida]|uniref:DUF7537 family lipoprotein n=1 Tax=Halorientalis pallida TaxID=2479928 RepID=UPI003C6FCFCF